MGELNGKIALITGASRGIGKAIAQRFAAEGASVVLCASRLGAHGNLVGTLEGAVEEINAAGGRAAAEVCDLTDPESRADLVERAARHFGPLDILVNNAARNSVVTVSNSSLSQRSGMFDLNVNVPVELTQQALPAMREKGAGWILNIGSQTAIQSPLPYPDSREANWVLGPYGATKAALNRITESLGHELCSEGIFVNVMAPTAIVMSPGADYVRAIAEKRPDMVEPVEMMAEGALELCSGRHVGQVVYSRDIVHRVARPLKSLDGKDVIGDAFTLADL